MQNVKDGCWKRRLIFASLEFYLTPKRYNLKNRFNYQPLFRIGAWASRSDSEDLQKSSLKIEIGAFF